MMCMLLSCRALSKTFFHGHYASDVLLNINLDIKFGERVAIMGASGSGKSTLLHLLGGLDVPTSGKILVKNNNLLELPKAMHRKLCSTVFGFVYQFHHLLAEFSVVDNVAMPLMIKRMCGVQAQKEALRFLSKVGLKHKAEYLPVELSGGERQLVALARALVTQPLCVLADEPTGNLDCITANRVFKLILELSCTLNIAFIIATHDLKLANLCQRILRLSESSLLSYNR